MKALPRQVNILGKIVHIHYVDRITIKDEGRDPNCMGLYETAESRIQVDVSLQDSMVISTLLHEVSHAILDRSGVRNQCRDTFEETICDAFGNALADVVSQMGTKPVTLKTARAQAEKSRQALEKANLASPKAPKAAAKRNTTSRSRRKVNYV